MKHTFFEYFIFILKIIIPGKCGPYLQNVALHLQKSLELNFDILVIKSGKLACHYMAFSSTVSLSWKIPVETNPNFIKMENRSFWLNWKMISTAAQTLSFSRNWVCDSQLIEYEHNIACALYHSNKKHLSLKQILSSKFAGMKWIHFSKRCTRCNNYEDVDSLTVPQKILFSLIR